MKRNLFLFTLLITFTLKLSAWEFPARKIRVPAANSNFLIGDISSGPQDYLWFSTTHGLYTYDGTEFSIFQFAEKEEKVTAFSFSRDTVVFGLENGNIYLDTQFIATIPGGMVTAIFYKNGRYWVGTRDSGVYHIYRGKLNRVKGLPDDVIYAAVQDPQGRIWAGTDKGILLFDSLPETHFRIFSQKTGLADNIVTSLALKPDGDILAGFFSGKVSCISPKTMQPQLLGTRHPKGMVNDILSNGKDIWLATEKGLYVIRDNDSIAMAAFTEGPVKGVTQDFQGNIWFSSGENIYYLSPFLSISGEISEPENFALVKSGTNLFISTPKGIYQMSPGGSVKLIIPSPHPSIFTCIYAAPDSNLYCGTLGMGLYCYSPETGNIRVYDEKDGLANNNILNITGKGKEIWFATFSGVSRGELSDGKLSILEYEPELPGNIYIYDIFIDTLGRKWFASDGKGIFIYDDHQITRFQPENHRLKSVYQIEGCTQKTWFLTNNNELFVYYDDSLRPYFAGDPGNLGKHPFAISSASEGGMLIFFEDGMEYHFSGKKAGALHFGERYGLGSPSVYSNAIFNAGGKAVYFAENGKIMEFIPPPKTRTPKLRLKTFEVFFTPLKDHHPGIKLKHNQNHITFRYAGLWYHEPEQLSYEIYLEGYDENWQNSTNRFITYNLPPGEYNFHIRPVLNGESNPGEEYSYAFMIAPPFYGQPWFIVLMLILLGGMLFAFIKIRENRLREEEALKQQALTAKLQTLQNQINPHFLFNSFNTLIMEIEEDSKKAAGYAAMLSDFFRNILQYKEENVIPLAKERSILENYLSIQKKRFGNNLMVTINIPESLNNRKIPPMTLQILVENALKHNIASSAKKLEIEITADNEFITVTNNYQPRTTVQDSTHTGLQNIRTRIALLTHREIRIVQDEKHFSVVVPLINE